jgi:hypothetical protein
VNNLFVRVLAQVRLPTVQVEPCLHGRQRARPAHAAGGLVHDEVDGPVGRVVLVQVAGLAVAVGRGGRATAAAHVRDQGGGEVEGRRQCRAVTVTRKEEKD